ncbi:unnamed protein product, partial [Rotaria magnacalcarata]
GVHPKCCNPPLNSIPKGDFACNVCRDEILLSPPNKNLSSSSSSSTRSRRSINLNDEDPPATLSRSVTELDDDIANFFIPNKQNLNNIRQQSVQKAVKYVRENKTIKSTNKKLLKRTHATTLNTNTIKENDELLAETILSSSKSPRIRKKLLSEDLCS